MTVPLDELVNVLEFEPLAQRALPPALYATIAGSERQGFNRITFRPRLMVDTTKIDLSSTLLGHPHFTPLLIGPAAQQRRFHPDGEHAMVRGAAAAKALLVLTADSSIPLDQLKPSSPFWFETHDAEPARHAVQLGAQAICLAPPVDWAAAALMRKAVKVPLLLKGIMHPAEAKLALAHGFDGLIVSSYRGHPDAAMASPLDVLPAIVAEVAGKVPVLVDGSIRRGSDVLKALALGAKAALVVRPVLWGLAAYGDRGVQQVLELLQSELARDTAMCGLPSLQHITPACIKVHRR